MKALSFSAAADGSAHLFRSLLPLKRGSSSDELASCLSPSALAALNNFSLGRMALRAPADDNAPVLLALLHLPWTPEVANPSCLGFLTK